MSNGKEIITLQLGHYSNYVGAHWWNIQESSFSYDSESQSEINHDILFREGQNNLGAVTYTPRLVLVDLKGSLKHLSTLGELYPEQSSNEENLLWPQDKIETMKNPKEEKSKYLTELENPTLNEDTDEDLDLEVKVWPDILKTRFHPRTVNVSNTFLHEDDSKPFDAYHLGYELWNEESLSEDVIDRIRKYAEECENMQGFHILGDSLNGFAGLTTKCLQHLADEYDNKPRLVFSVARAQIPNRTPIQGVVQSINQALFFADLSEYASLFVPLSLASETWRDLGEPRQFSSLNYKAHHDYHTSSILAVALDTITLKYRLRNSSDTLNELTNNMSRLGRRAIAGSLQLPFPIADNYLFNLLETWEGPYWQSLTPSCTLDKEGDMWMQSIVLRGIPENKLRNSMSRNEPLSANSNYAYKCSTIKEMYTWFMQCSFNYAVSNVSSSKDLLKLERPFPKILQNIDNSSTTDKGNLPVMAGLHSTKEIGSMLESLHKTVYKFNINKFFKFNVDEDEYRESLEQLKQLKDCYEENFD